MNVTNTTYLASYATDLKAADVRDQISMSVLKEIKDQGERQGNSLVKMIEQTNEVINNGHVDTYA